MTEQTSSPDTPLTGATSITPETIEAVRAQEENFEQLLAKVRVENPALYEDILRSSERYAHDIKRKEAFVQGVLHLYALEANQTESTALLELLNFTVDDDAAVPRLSGAPRDGQVQP